LHGQYSPREAFCGSRLLEASHGYFSFDGCFWHGCPLHATRPKSNAAFWRKNVAANHGHLIRADFLDPLFAFPLKLR